MYGLWSYCLETFPHLISSLQFAHLASTFHCVLASVSAASSSESTSNIRLTRSTSAQDITVISSGSESDVVFVPPPSTDSMPTINKAVRTVSARQREENAETDQPFVSDEAYSAEENAQKDQPVVSPANSVEENASKNKSEQPVRPTTPTGRSHPPSKPFKGKVRANVNAEHIAQKQKILVSVLIRYYFARESRFIPYKNRG